MTAITSGCMVQALNPCPTPVCIFHAQVWNRDPGSQRFWWQEAEIDSLFKHIETLCLAAKKVCFVVSPLAALRTPSGRILQGDGWQSVSNASDGFRKRRQGQGHRNWVSPQPIIPPPPWFTQDPLV